MSTDIPVIAVSAAMALGNICTDDQRRKFKLKDEVLIQMNRMIRDAADGKSISCNGMSFCIEEILESAQNFMDCPENCSYFIRRGVIGKFYQNLKDQNDSKVIDLTLCCLNKAFTRLLYLIRNPQGLKREGLMSCVKVEGLADILTKLKNMKNKSFSAVAETCLIKMTEILDGRSHRKCQLQDLCKEFLKTELKIDGKVFFSSL